MSIMRKTTLFIKSMRLTFLLLVLNSYQTIATEFTDVVENVTPAVVAIDTAPSPAVMPFAATDPASETEDRTNFDPSYLRN